MDGATATAPSPTAPATRLTEPWRTSPEANTAGKRVGEHHERHVHAHRVIDGADHEGLIGTEKGAAATTQAILDVVQTARSHTSLG